MLNYGSSLNKILLVGDAAVGKTRIIQTLITDNPLVNPLSTIGVEFISTTLTLKDGGVCKVQIWDTSGQERFQQINVAHYQGAVGALIVYDITKEQTFQNVPYWLEQLRRHGKEDALVMLIGNKLDLCHVAPGMRKVYKQAAHDFAVKHDLLFGEISGFNKNQIVAVFQFLLENITQEKQLGLVDEERPAEFSGCHGLQCVLF